MAFCRPFQLEKKGLLRRKAFLGQSYSLSLLKFWASKNLQGIDSSSVQYIEELILKIFMGVVLSVEMDSKLIHMKSTEFLKELYNLNWKRDIAELKRH